jgi:hypothetical protein
VRDTFLKHTRVCPPMFEFAARHLQFVVCVGVGHAGAEEHLAAYAPFFLRTQVAPIWCQP